MQKRKEWNSNDKCKGSKQSWSVKGRPRRKQDNKRQKGKLLLKERLRWSQQPELQQSTKTNLRQKRQQRKKFLDNRRLSVKRLKEKQQL